MKVTLDIVVNVIIMIVIKLACCRLPSLHACPVLVCIFLRYLRGLWEASEHTREDNRDHPLTYWRIVQSFVETSMKSGSVFIVLTEGPL